MPTWAKTKQFARDFTRLSPSERAAFLAAVRNFTADLRAGEGFRNGLRVKGVQGAKGVFEMTWAPDGRATFQYGPPQVVGESHVIWRRVGSHDIFKDA